MSLASGRRELFGETESKISNPLYKTKTSNCTHPKIKPHSPSNQNTNIPS